MRLYALYPGHEAARTTGAASAASCNVCSVTLPLATWISKVKMPISMNSGCNTDRCECLSQPCSVDQINGTGPDSLYRAARCAMRQRLNR